MGPQGAASLLRRYGSIEDAIKAGRLTAQAEMLRLYRAIATMDSSAPLPPLRTKSQAGHRPRSSPVIGSSRSWRTGWKAWPPRREVPAAGDKVRQPTASVAPGGAGQ